MDITNKDKEEEFLKALECKDAQSVQNILKDDSILQVAKDSLLEAVKAANEKSAIFLVHCGVPPTNNNPEEWWDDSPLHKACEMGLVDFVKAIPNIEEYMDSKKINEEWFPWPDASITPFQSAIVGYRQMVKEPWYDLERGQSPSYETADPPQEMTELLIYFLGKGADANSPCQGPCRGDERLALHLACSTPCNVELARVLIKCGADINAVNSEHFTPLLTAIKSYYPQGNLNEYLELIEELLKAGADTSSVMPDKQDGIREDKNALSYAMSCNLKVMNLLIKYGADVNQFDCQGDPILFKRLAHNCLTDKSRKVKFTHCLFKHPSKVDLNMKGNNGQNIVHILCSGYYDEPGLLWAALHQQPEIQTLFNIPDDNGTLPLCNAVDNLNLKTALVLIHNKALVNILNSEQTSIFDTVVDRYALESAHDMCYKHLGNWSALEHSRFKKPFYVKMDTKSFEKLCIFCEVILNKGILSEVVYTCKQITQGGGQTWEQQHLQIGGFGFSQFVHYLLVGNHVVSAKKGIISGEIILEFARLLCHADIILCLRDYRELEDSLKLLCLTSKFHSKAYLTLQAVVNCMKEEVVELKRLCRKRLRIYISTIYGTNLIPFDLRDICTSLPVPSGLQNYITIHLDYENNYL